MKHILIPVNLSDPSWKVALCTLHMYQQPGVYFYLLNASVEKAPVEPENDNSDILKWKNKLEPFLAPNQKITALRCQGNFIGNIREAVYKNDIDLIVLGIEFSNFSTYSIKGSRTKDIITRVKCSVLMIPQNFKCAKLEEIVLVSDFNFTHRARVTYIVSEFVNDIHAHLNVLQLSNRSKVLTPSQAVNKSFMQTNLGHVSLRFHFVVDKTMAKALQFYINRNQVDLVILFAKNINLLENILFSSALNGAIDYYKKIPFLIIHE